MKALTGVVILFVAILTYWVYQQEKAIETLKAEIAEKKKDRSLFEYQERCAEAARKSYSDMGFKNKEWAAFENHYNEKLNRCFIEITDVETNGGRIVTSKSIFDAVEGKQYGEYIWQSDKVKKYWEVPPILCDVISPSGEKTLCKSDDEYKELLKPYMDIS